jgi:hypothetical protein
LLLFTTTMPQLNMMEPTGQGNFPSVSVAVSSEFHMVQFRKEAVLDRRTVKWGHMQYRLCLQADQRELETRTV